MKWSKLATGGRTMRKERTVKWRSRREKQAIDWMGWESEWEWDRGGSAHPLSAFSPKKSPLSSVRMNTSGPFSCFRWVTFTYEPSREVSETWPLIRPQAKDRMLELVLLEARGSLTWPKLVASHHTRTILSCAMLLSLSFGELVTPYSTLIPEQRFRLYIEGIETDSCLLITCLYVHLWYSYIIRIENQAHLHSAAEALTWPLLTNILAISQKD